MKIDEKKLGSDFEKARSEKSEKWLNDWKEIVAARSVSATGEGVAECCELVKSKMEAAGLVPEVLDIKPFPALYAEYGADPEKKTILIYAHYDVVPVGNLALWESDPFDPVIREGKMYARGSADNKSPLMAHLEAFAFMKEMYGELPVNVKFLFEGCEESGSKGLPDFLAANREKLKADFVFFSDGPKNEAGIPIIALGCKGSMTVTIKLRTMNRDSHSRYAPVLPSASWQMVELLGKLKTGDHVNVPGFYDGIVPPTEKELAVYNALPSIEKEMEEIYGAKVLYPEETGYYVHLNTTPTFNLKQLHSGEGAGVVNCTAVATLDIRLVEGMEPDDVFAKLKKYVVDLGYTNAEVTMGAGVTYPSKTPVETEYLPDIEKVTKEVYGDYVIYPCRPSSAPDYLWTRILGLPAIQVRWSDVDSNNHAPNEHMTVSEYYRGIELTVKVLNAFGK